MALVAVSARGSTPDDGVDPRFGRAAGFVVYDTATSGWSFLPNTVSRDLPQGAGLAAAEMLARAGIGVVLTGSVGPKAALALGAAKIAFRENTFRGTIRQAVAEYLATRKLGEALA